jgi:hypothetical protein
MKITPLHIKPATGYPNYWLNKSKLAHCMLAFCVALLFSACSKDKVILPPPVNEEPNIRYIDFGNREIVLGTDGVPLDLTGDNRTDVLFDLYLIGDGINMIDKWTWSIITSRFGYLPVSLDDALPVMEKGDNIPLENFNGFEWYVANEIILMQRFENLTGQISWGGQWMNAQKKYLPISLLIEGERYNGWIELSASTTDQKLTLHRAGLSKLPNTAIKAGL